MVKVLKSRSPDWNIGLYGLPLSNIFLVGKEINPCLRKEINLIWDGDVLELKIGGLSTISIFLAGFEDKVIVHKDFSSHDLKSLEEKNIKIIELKSSFNALGNNIIFYNDKALVNEHVSKEDIDVLSSYLKEVERFSKKEVECIGQLVVSDGKKAVLSNLLMEEDVEFIKDFFKFREVIVSTINFGSPFLKSGIIISKNILVGKNTTPVELINISELFFNCNCLTPASSL